MKIRLEDIPPEGLEVEFSDLGLTPGDLGDQVVGIKESPTARLRVERSGDTVIARGDFAARLAVSCSRCLDEMEITLGGPLEMVFMPQPEGGGDEVCLDADDLEVNFYTGEEIDLSLGMRDEVALALPMAPLCRPDCGGICAGCGCRQGVEACGCGEKPLDPRWAKLKKLDLN